MQTYNAHYDKNNDLMSVHILHPIGNNSKEVPCHNTPIPTELFKSKHWKTRYIILNIRNGMKYKINMYLLTKSPSTRFHKKILILPEKYTQIIWAHQLS